MANPTRKLPQRDMAQRRSKRPTKSSKTLSRPQQQCEDQELHLGLTGKLSRIMCNTGCEVGRFMCLSLHEHAVMTQPGPPLASHTQIPGLCNNSPRVQSPHQLATMRQKPHQQHQQHCFSGVGAAPQIRGWQGPDSISSWGGRFRQQKYYSPHPPATHKQAAPLLRHTAS